MAWETKVQEALSLRDATLQQVDPPLAAIPDILPLNSQDLPAQFLTAREYELTQSYDAVQLVQMLRSKQVTSLELTKAFLRRAALAQYALNCITELMWDEACERASYLDSLSEPLGPLHGLPISVKEQHGMKGKTQHGSWVAWVGKDSEPNNVMNEILYGAGCVFYARTTCPQTVMHLETENNIYGRTVNPWNRNLTSGGSSGGEGALVGFRGSVLGVGGDIGGSVRVPAANCGVYGFKPTVGRLSTKGMTGPTAGRDSILATPGPIAQSREAIHLFMQTILDGEPWRMDPSLVNKPWTRQKLDGPLKVAIEWHDGVVKPHPPVIRAMQEVAQACRDAGMEVVDWDPLDHEKGWDITSALYYPDGGASTKSLLASEGEPALPLTDFIIDEQPTVKPLTMHEYWKLCVEREQYRSDYAAHWNKTAHSGNGKEVDAIICPTTPGAAPLHGTSRYWPYTSQWNLLDYPTAVFPVTFVDPELDKVEEGFVPMSEKDKYNHMLYSPEAFVGAPISLSIVGRRHMDEKVMAVLERVERAMGRE
ncbi:amidase [Aspergillus californicus]